MASAVLFIVVALRAMIELIVWLMVGRAVLTLLAGHAGKDNAILRLFDVVLGPPRSLMVKIFPKIGFVSRELLLLGLLMSIWLILALVKWWLRGS